MKQGIKDRTLEEAKYMISTRCTVQECADHFKRNVKNVTRDLKDHLNYLEPSLWEQVEEIKRNNKNRKYGFAVVQLDYYDFSFVAEYTSLGSLAADYDLTHSAVSATLKNSKNGIYISKSKELLVLKKEVYNKLKGVFANDKM